MFKAQLTQVMRQAEFPSPRGDYFFNFRKYTIIPGTFQRFRLLAEIIFLIGAGL